MAVEEPSPKRRKVGKVDDAGETTIYETKCLDRSGGMVHEVQESTIHRSAYSSFSDFQPLAMTLSTLANDRVIDISKYIPAGALRLHQVDCAAALEAWTSQDYWCAITHPRDAYNDHYGSLLLTKLQEQLLATSLQPYQVLLASGWVRMEFKSNDQYTGQARVYVLPDDVGRTSIDRKNRTLRRSMQRLFGKIDIAIDTWHGSWSDEQKVTHIDSVLDRMMNDDDMSLLNIFNSLPSPSPDPQQIINPHASEAMNCILDSDIEGLNTKLYSYQRRSAAAMVQREIQPEQIIDPRLRRFSDHHGNQWYCDIDATSFLREPRIYEAPRGGICAENMGLGKTLICLALILATRDLSSEIPIEYSIDLVPVRKSVGSLRDMAAATLGRTAMPWKNHFAYSESQNYEFKTAREAIYKEAGHYYITGEPRRLNSRHPVGGTTRKIWLSTATIVVVPANLVQQWRAEIKKHTTGLKILVMVEFKTQLPPARQLADYDIILFSRQRFDKEARDGSDTEGRRRTTSNRVCCCPYIGATIVRKCNCFKESDIYKSPLREIHFKRLIVDEGHTYGTSTNTESSSVVEFLQLTSRWIISGTPTKGLYGTEFYPPSEKSSGSNTPHYSDSSSRSTQSKDFASSSDFNAKDKLFYAQERQDLERLGNIAMNFLKARPWAWSPDGDIASWAQHVMQPRHGSKSRGNLDCLKATLEGMIIRHRPEDVIHDVVLPPLIQNVIYLEGSIQNKLTLNTFNMMNITNAITSERKDADYFFHPKQRKNLQSLVSNLRQGSFFWSGFEPEHIRSTISNAKRFLEKKEVPVTPADESLLKEAIKIGELVIANHVSQLISKWDEMPMFIHNDLPEDVRLALSLDGQSGNPTLMGATMVHAAQKFVDSQLHKANQMDGLVQAAQKAAMAVKFALDPRPGSTRNNQARKFRPSNKLTESVVALAGGVTLGEREMPKKRSQSSFATKADRRDGVDTPQNTIGFSKDEDLPGLEEFKAHSEDIKKFEPPGSLGPSSPLSSANIVSTASTKLSYLMDRIIMHQSEEKILVFYEATNVAYYIAQSLECLGVSHLIYAKELTPKRRARYVVTFNRSEVFRVLLMDVSQAAFGLDISSASRVFFVNPVFSPQVEAQAVKRAHRIGQLKPVFVETLVLKGSIEEAIMDRRKQLSEHEHNKCKSILDDESMFDWIRNVRFLPLPEAPLADPDQMAKLEIPQGVFGRRAGARREEHDPDADLVFEGDNPKIKSNRKKISDKNKGIEAGSEFRNY